MHLHMCVHAGVHVCACVRDKGHLWAHERVRVLVMSAHTPRKLHAKNGHLQAV